MLHTCRPNRLLNVSTTVLWNCEITKLVNRQEFRGALIAFREMQRDGLKPNKFTFPLLLKACATLSDLRISQSLHSHTVKLPLYHNVFVLTATVDMYIKCGRLEMASAAFRDMQTRDVASWNVMIMGYTQFGFINEVAMVFREMRFGGVTPDAVTMIGLSQISNSLGFTKAVHSFGICIGVDINVALVNTWVSVYAKCGDLVSAESIFRDLNAGLRSVVSWNSLITGYANLRKEYDALNAYRCMLCDDCLPDSGTIVGVLSACVAPQFLPHGILIHSHAIKSGCDCCVPVLNALMSMYSRCGEVHVARYVFDKMPLKSRVSWTALISGYANEGNINEAIRLFRAMDSLGENPDYVTLLCLISSCAQAGSLKLGKCLHSYSFLKGFAGNIEVLNTIIDMYAKCGSIADAQKMFDESPHRNHISWTTMINGCGLNSLFHKATDLFDRMLKMGLKPNHITYLAILQACCHGGFLEKGKQYFKMMIDVHGVEAGVYHYACMVDLFGRKGKVNEAVELLKKMPAKADAAMWGSLLSACKIHGNVAVGEFAAGNLRSVEDSSATFVEMSNLYASAGKWESVRNIRTEMRQTGLRKYAGQSAIEVDGKIHIFTVEDRDHLSRHTLYGALECFALHSRRQNVAAHPLSISSDYF